MSRVVHFEIHASEPERLVAFYEHVFGWSFTAWEGPWPYWLIDTGEAPPGINGGLLRRRGDAPAVGQPVNAFVCTVGVADVAATVARAVEGGGAVAVPVDEVAGIGRLAYVRDPDGNLVGVLEPVG